MDEIESAVSEEKEIEWRYVSLMIAFFGNFGRSGLWRKPENQQFSNEYSGVVTRFLIET